MSTLQESSTQRAAVDHQCLVRPLRIIADVFGWFDSPEQGSPTHDPGPEGICPQCTHPVGRHSIDNPIKTISLAVEDMEYRTRSYFFRAHQNCWDRATPHDRMMVEQRIHPPSVQPEIKQARSGALDGADC